MQAAMLPFPYPFACQPCVVESSVADCVTSTSPLSSPLSSCLSTRCYDSIVTTRFRSHELSSATARFTGLLHDPPPKGYTPPSRKLFTIEAILGLNEDKGARASIPTIYGSPIDIKDPSPPSYTSHHSALHRPSPSISVSSSTGAKGAGHPKAAPVGGGKMKRIRTIFTPEQLERLELEFERQQYMVGPERMYLASSLGLSESQVKVWFQNRRIKFRKQHLELQQARLAQLRETGEETAPESDYHSKEVSSTHWDDLTDVQH